jgi:uncharacterized protein (TIGR03000 family)
MLVPTADAQILRRRARVNNSGVYQQGVYRQQGVYGPGMSTTIPGYSSVPYVGSGMTIGSGMPIGMGTQGYVRGIQGYGYTVPYTGSTIVPGYATPGVNVIPGSQVMPSGALPMPGASPVVPSGTITTPGATSGETHSHYRPPAGAASITVKLPANARLTMNDQPTTPTGPERLFVTPAGLEQGKSYYFTLKAQWEENGQTVTRERVLEFKAGDTATVDLTQNPTP